MHLQKAGAPFDLFVRGSASAGSRRSRADAAALRAR
jgi:hypothetical protein